MNKKIESLLQKEMDRKEFFKYAVAAGLMALGGGAIIRSLGGLEASGKTEARAEKSTLAMGYGANVYGGSSVEAKSKILQ